MVFFCELSYGRGSSEIEIWKVTLLQLTLYDEDCSNLGKLTEWNDQTNVDNER